MFMYTMFVYKKMGQKPLLQDSFMPQIDPKPQNPQLQPKPPNPQL